MMKHSSDAVLYGGMDDFTNWVGTLGVPIPHILGALGKYIEFIGGAFVSLGFITRFFASLIAANLLIAISLTEGLLAFFYADIPATYMLLGIAIVLNGPGKMSIDSYFVQKVFKNT